MSIQQENAMEVQMKSIWKKTWKTFKLGKEATHFLQLALKLLNLKA